MDITNILSKNDVKNFFSSLESFQLSNTHSDGINHYVYFRFEMDGYFSSNVLQVIYRKNRIIVKYNGFSRDSIIFKYDTEKVYHDGKSDFGNDEFVEEYMFRYKNESEKLKKEFKNYMVDKIRNDKKIRIKLMVEQTEFYCFNKKISLVDKTKTA